MICCLINFVSFIPHQSEVKSDIDPNMKLLGLFLVVVGCVYADDDDRKENVGTVVGIDLGTTYSW